MEACHQEYWESIDGMEDSEIGPSEDNLIIDKPQVWDLELEDLVARDWFDDIVFNPIESNGELDLIPFPLDCFETLPNESIAAKAAPIISELEQILARTGLDQSGWREAEQLQLKILELIVQKRSIHWW
jgi:hypothetical protein